MSACTVKVPSNVSVMRFNLRVQSKWCQSPSDTSWLMNTPFDPEIKSNACQTINNWNCIKGLFQGWPVHFVYKAIYESLFVMELEKLLVNDRVTASCQTNWSRSQVCYDGDDNENVKRAIGWIGKATPLHVQHGFFVHFFAVTARLRRENALFHVLWRTQTNDVNLNVVLRNSAQKECACIWQSKPVGVIAIQIERTHWIHLLSDVFVVVVVVVS